MLAWSCIVDNPCIRPEEGLSIRPVLLGDLSCLREKEAGYFQLAHTRYEGFEEEVVQQELDHWASLRSLSAVGEVALEASFEGVEDLQLLPCVRIVVDPLPSEWESVHLTDQRETRSSSVTS